MASASQRVSLLPLRMVYSLRLNPVSVYPSFAPVLKKILTLALLFILELICLSIWVDNESLAGGSGAAVFIRSWGAWIVKGAVGFAALFMTCAFLKNRLLLEEISARLQSARLRKDLILAHFALLAVFSGLSDLMYGGSVHGGAENLLAFVWLTAGVATLVLGAFSFIPFEAWRSLLLGTGLLWMYVLAGVVAACVIGNSIRLLWAPAARLTLGLVHAMLVPFLSGVVADPSRMHIGTAKFSVEIAKECSGLEGIGLILTFTTVWLLLFRGECRFPNALVLLPAGVAIMFLLNAVRIAVLVLIGNAGAERIALGGFHSQAGWIAFNAVALGMAVGARKLPWVVATPRADASESSAPAALHADHATVAFLLPFVAILATGMAATALSAGFEWLYPLRFFVAGAVLWHFRKHYARLEWRCTWAGPAAGVLVFALWVALDPSTGSVSGAMPPALAAAPAPLRFLWITFRALAAVITVPVAEELAFRAYAVRRIISVDFESVSPRTFTWASLIISSVLFGALHGGRWFAGTVAGSIYALVLLRRGKTGDCVVAHATTNAMLAAYVIAFQHWEFW